MFSQTNTFNLIQAWNESCFKIVEMQSDLFNTYAPWSYVYVPIDMKIQAKPVKIVVPKKLTVQKKAAPKIKENATEVVAVELKSKSVAKAIVPSKTQTVPKKAGAILTKADAKSTQPIEVTAAQTTKSASAKASVAPTAVKEAAAVKPKPAAQTARKQPSVPGAAKAKIKPAQRRLTATPPSKSKN